MRLERKVGQKLIQSKKTLSVAESCTGGLISDLLTNVPGSSNYFFLGVAAYDNAAKTKILKVPVTLIKKHGAVSLVVAQAMAQGVRRILKTDYGLSVTGIAGPGGGSAAKPVGLVFIGLSDPKKTIVQEFLFKGSRLAIKKQAASAALKILVRYV